jgi:two-component sensor histidine kinase
MTIASVHHRLYDGGSITATNAAHYLRGLLDDMKMLLPSGDDRPIALDIEPFSLAADDITPLGLITGELVTNAFKHGSGAVSVTVRQTADGMTVAVSDEGPGFPADFDPTVVRGLGMRLIATLAKSTYEDAVQIDRSVPHGRIVVRLGFGGAKS